jgi:hypothetical protein
MYTWLAGEEAMAEEEEGFCDQSDMANQNS